MCMRRYLLTVSGLSLIAAVFAACGGNVGLDAADGSPEGSLPEASTDVATGACGAPEFCCGLNNNGCEIAVSMAMCVSTSWVCPSGQTPGIACGAPCSLDGGDAGDATVHLDAATDAREGGVTRDATHDGHDANPNLFSCGGMGLTCNELTQYCNIVEGGAPVEGGSSVHDSCEAIPAACVGALTCSCVKQVTSSSGTCTDDDGALTLTLEAP